MLRPVCLTAAPAKQEVAARVSGWREDIDYFAQEFPARQKDFYLLIPKEEFEHGLLKLKRRVSYISDQDIIMRLTRIVASLGVGHTNMKFPSGTEKHAFQVYPIRVQWFSDGLAVVAAAREYHEALGNRVVRIGTKSPEQVEAVVAPYISSENSMHLRICSANIMKYAELMQREKIADAAGHLHVTYAKRNGERFTLDIAPVAPGETRPELLAATAAFQTPALFCHKRPKAFYWHEYLPDSRTLYIQYRKCLEEPGNPFADFTEKLFAFTDSNTIDRVVVDLRFNSGGGSGLVKPLISGLKSRSALSGRGRLYALIGGHTYSSAMFAVLNLRKECGAILVGEPTGNKPNHYGEIGFFELPNSKLKVKYSTKHMHPIRNADPPFIAPDIYVPCSLKDYLAGRDPVLDAVLRHTPDKK